MIKLLAGVGGTPQREARAAVMDLTRPGIKYTGMPIPNSPGARTLTSRPPGPAVHFRSVGPPATLMMGRSSNFAGALVGMKFGTAYTSRQTVVKRLTYYNGSSLSQDSRMSGEGRMKNGEGDSKTHVGGEWRGRQEVTEEKRGEVNRVKASR